MEIFKDLDDMEIDVSQEILDWGKMQLVEIKELV